MAGLPPGVERPKPRTREQAKRLFSNDKIKNLTKLKLQQYIESFFNNDGLNRSLLAATSPRFVNYNISKSFDPAVDPTQRRMQIARYFNELRSILPAILVVDGGIEYVAHNIGLIADAIVENGQWSGYYPIVRRIPLTIIAAARDMDEADELSGLVSLMFNELRNLAGGHYITGKPEEGETWTIMLPQGGVSVGALSEADVQGDPIERIWYAEAAMEVLFEDTLAVSQPAPAVHPGGVLVGEPDLRATLKPVIDVPSVISLNSQVRVHVSNLQDHYRVILSNAKVATIAYNMLLTPRSLGKVKILVVDYSLPHDPNKTVVAEKEIEIVL